MSTATATGGTLGIQWIRQSAAFEPLQPDGPVARPLSEPACITRSAELRVAGMGSNTSGIWECSPGRYTRVIAQAEFMHFLSGRCSFVTAGGESLAFQAGDTVLFPQNTFGTWDIAEPLRKAYVILNAP